MSILSFYIVIPLLALVVIVLTRDIRRIWLLSALAIGLQLILTAVLIFLFSSGGNKGSEEMSFAADVVWFTSLNIHFITGADAISIAMLAMTSLIFLSGILTTSGDSSVKKEFHILLMLIVTGSNGYLISEDLFSMFMFLGVSIIPFWFLFRISENGPKKHLSTIHLIMLAGGYAILLIGILGIYISSVPDGNKITFNISEIDNYLIPIQAQRVFFPMAFAGLAVIAGLFPFHLPVPANLSSGPSAVPMLYSGVLMKLGAYGILRIAIYLMPSAAGELSWLLLTLAAITVIYGAAGTMLHKGMNQLNAYSSIAFSGLILFMLMLMNKATLTGAVLLMLSHGLVSALQFGLSAMINNRAKTDSPDNLKGLLRTMPFLSASYLFAILALAILPGISGCFKGFFHQPETLNMILAIVTFSFMVLLAARMIFITAKFTFTQKKNAVFHHSRGIGWHEKASVIILIVPLILFAAFPLWFAEGFGACIQNILNRISEISPL